MTDSINKEISADEVGTRLHKSSPLFILIHVVIKSIIPLAFGVFTYGASKYSNNLVIAATVFIASFALLQYWFYHYWIKDEKIEIKEGIFFKNNRKVPYTRIQNVNVSQNPLQRIFKVATLQLESASGGKPEAVMRVVDLEVVETIKRKVKMANSIINESIISDDNDVDTESRVTTDKKPPLHAMPVKEVIQYGIISQKGMFYGAILFGFLAQNQGLMTWIVVRLDYFYDVPDFTKITLAEGAIYVLVIGLVMFVFLQFMSILWSLMRFYDFKIEKQGDRLQAHMGLLSKVAATIPLKKIQLYRISENPLHKYFKARTITI
jgi:putative membrane protein